MKPIARVAAANTAIMMTDFVNVATLLRIHIIMLVKIKYEVGKLFEIARACGVAPCTIILANGKRNESELSGEIVVPVETASRCRIIKDDIRDNKSDYCCE